MFFRWLIKKAHDMQRKWSMGVRALLAQRQFHTQCLICTLPGPFCLCLNHLCTPREGRVVFSKFSTFNALGVWNDFKIYAVYSCLLSISLVRAAPSHSLLEAWVVLAPQLAAAKQPMITFPCQSLFCKEYFCLWAVTNVLCLCSMDAVRASLKGCI